MAKNEEVDKPKGEVVESPHSPKSKPKRKLPPKLPTFRVKAIWRTTALYMTIQARNEDEAWEKASKVVKKLDGGSGCEEIKVLERISDD